MVTVTSYAYLKIDQLIKKTSIDVLESVRENYISDDDVFGSSQGFNIAIGFTGWGEPVEDLQTELLDKSYGEIKFMASEWSVNENREFTTNFYEIE